MSEELGIYLKLDELDLQRTDFDKQKFKPFLRIIGGKLRKSARLRVNSYWISKPNTYPGKSTGALQKAISVKYFRSGYGLKLQQDMPKRTAGNKKKEAFYPAFLRYGATNEKKPRWRILPRRNYIEDSFELHRQEMVDSVARALGESLKGIFDR